MILVSPLDGWSSSLDEVPDPVFSGKLVGDGVAIDPTSATLCAPCDGEVVTIAAAGHAVTLRAPGGAEILLHVGCDTVALGGDGFQVHASKGAMVRAGDPLLTFDLDAVASRVPSLLTPIVLMDGQRFEIARRAEQQPLRVGDFLMELHPLGGGELRRHVRVPYEHGIHARPAALLVTALRGFTAEVTALAHGRKVNARSAVGWMELGAKRGDEITLVATGSDAEAALAALERALAASAAEAVGGRRSAVGLTADRPIPAVIASRGLALGPASLIMHTVPAPTETGTGADLDRARDLVRSKLERLRDTSTGLAREVLEAHLAFLDDPELLQSAQSSIAKGKSAGSAWHDAVEQSVKALLAVGDPRVAERADDLRDLSAQVLRALAGESPLLDPPAGSILVGQELLPSQLVALPPGRIAGFCTAAGGPTSHVALLAAAMNLPALVAAGADVLRIAEGTPLVLDAEEGLLRIAPDAATLAAAEQKLARRRVQKEAARNAAPGQCRLASGERIEVFANIAAVAEVAAAIEQGAEGCGLLRSEFLFLDRETPPGVDEQTDAYQRVVTAFGGRPVVIRTLDAGSDKPLRYLPLPRGENPALGVRGVRASLSHPELLRDQLRAILRVEPASCHILLPMITDVCEVESVRRILDGLCRESGCAQPMLGVMIETPASALLAAQLAEAADFLSIGSNDLAQYTLAMDRGQAELAAQLDALHPAVLRLIRATAEAGRAAGRPVAVCGGLASDPLAAPLLVGLGVNELSAVPSVIPELKATLRAVSMDDCRALAERALEARCAAAVRTLARDAGGNR